MKAATMNLRFLILPWVRVKNLGSYLLSASLSAAKKRTQAERLSQRA